MISHGEKCSHCHANMSLPKLVTDGPKKGQYRTVCSQCGHIEYHLDLAFLQPKPTH